MITKNDVEMALNEKSGLTDKHRAQILEGAYREAVEALKSVQRYIEGEPWEDIDISKIIDKYPEE